MGASLWGGSPLWEYRLDVFMIQEQPRAEGKGNVARRCLGRMPSASGPPPLGLWLDFFPWGWRRGRGEAGSRPGPEFFGGHFQRVQCASRVKPDLHPGRLRPFAGPGELAIGGVHVLDDFGFRLFLGSRRCGRFARWLGGLAGRRLDRGFCFGGRSCLRRWFGRDSCLGRHTRCRRRGTRLDGGADLLRDGAPGAGSEYRPGSRLLLASLDFSPNADKQFFQLR